MEPDVLVGFSADLIGRMKGLMVVFCLLMAVFLIYRLGYMIGFIGGVGESIEFLFTNKAAGSGASRPRSI